MQAVVFEEFGGPEKLAVADRPMPEPGPGQVRVRVRAAGVNPLDAKIRSGAMAHVFPTDLPSVPGLEIAGTVAEVGAEVAGLSAGDEVFGFADTGGYAEYALATVVALKPARLPWTAAAGLPLAAMTALDALDELAIRDGETLLIHGASGGIGSITVQLAAARGATVIGTASETNQDHLRGLGAVPVVYGPGLRDRVPGRVDAVLDVAGRGALADLIAVRGDATRIVTLADSQAEAYDVPFLFVRRRDANELADVAAQASDGRLTVTVGASFPLERAGEAQAAVATGHARGKTVLTVGLGGKR
jgi:NADPH:quinone reductase-like Zn-dependent oxidoreductase